MSVSVEVFAGYFMLSTIGKEVKVMGYFRKWEILVKVSCSKCEKLCTIMYRLKIHMKQYTKETRKWKAENGGNISMLFFRGDIVRSPIML